MQGRAWQAGEVREESARPIVEDWRWEVETIQGRRPERREIGHLFEGRSSGKGAAQLLGTRHRAGPKIPKL
jgi:hypothetical protein